jgi:two-component system response regulator WspF
LSGNNEQARQSKTAFLKKIKTIIKLQGKASIFSPSDTVSIRTETDQRRTTTKFFPEQKRTTKFFSEGTERLRRKTEAFRMNAIYVPPLVVIGSSTGGPKTLVKLFSRLPEHLEAAIVVVQHLDQEFSAGLAEWLNIQTPLRVRVAVRGTHPAKGVIDVAGTNDHLVLTAGLTLAYTLEPHDNPYRPSVDVFFRSVARYWPEPGCAVLLTGMGRDGAVELLNLRSLGWHTIAQDQATSVVYGMPKAAKELDAAIEVLPIEEIAPAILKFVTQAKQMRHA